MNTYKYIVDKYNINVGSQHIIDIPNMGRNNLAELFAELGFNYGVEVGVQRGDYSEILCKANPNLHLYSIDPFLVEAYEKDSLEISGTQDLHEDNFEAAKNKLAPYNCTIVRKFSMDALEDFEDNSLDFVYIDANHDFPNVINDIHQWLKKVREDGIISGHDYANFSYKKFNHVKRALVPYARCYRMQPLFIVGAQEYDSKDGPSPGRDKYRSWFWVKKKGGLR